MAASLHSLSLTRQTLSLNHYSSAAAAVSSLLAPISLKSLPKLVLSLSSTGNYSQPISRFVRHVGISSDLEGFDFGSKEKLKHRGNSAITAASKKENKLNKEEKKDSHSFAVKPDEATGPFPEAVLMRERKVEEDGRLLPEFEDVEERELFEALNLQRESDMDADRMRHYEVVYLIHEDHKDEVENVNTKVREFVEEKKGRIWRFNDWGMRRLAYKIQKAKNAHYILMNFEVEAKWINDFKSMLDRDERVIRHLVMKQDKAETKDCPPPPEFHSLHGDMPDDADEDEDEEEYEDDEDYVDEDDEGVIYVDEVEMSSDSVTNTLKPEKVGR